jgi:hypothetical protein
LFLYQIASTYQFSEFLTAAKVPELLVRDVCNPWKQGLVSIKEDMSFAEDLMLYQEEIIDTTWTRLVALEAIITEKDKLIDQLYNQISEREAELSVMKSGNSSLAAISLFTSTSSSVNKNHRNIQAIADREFYEADVV